MPIYSDALGREVRCAQRPQRIVSLCPSLTATIFSLGAANRLVGRTEFCVLPAPQVESVATVGGTKNVDVNAVQKLEPDIIIAEQEENTRPKVERLAREFPVFVCKNESIDQAMTTIRQLGDLLDCQTTARELSRRIDGNWQKLPPLKEKMTVVYLIWNKPLMLAGESTFIDAMLDRAGYDNLGKRLSRGRYPRIELDELKTLAPQILMLSSEPYSFRQREAEDLQKAIPAAQILAVDGRIFSWYGSHMLHAVDYFLQLRRKTIRQS
jgi:iron complex transport system substrate-binding protein